MDRGSFKELYNLLLTGEMDELNFTLSIIGLAMDLPFDAGFVGDAGVATMKAFSSMIPAGPAREVLLDVVKQVGKNPEQIGALGTAVWKLLGKEDLMKVLVDNPNALKAVLEGGSEAVENLLKHEDELIKLGKAVDEDMLKVAMDSSETALKNADELGEAGGKALAEGAGDTSKIIDDLDEDSVRKLSNMQKGNYGEMVMDDYFTKEGYERISLDKVTGLDDTTHQGIDGVYFNPDGNPQYIIAEAKYGTSQLGNTIDGKQMNETWIDNRLVDAVGKEKAAQIRQEILFNPENVQSNLVKVKPDGSTVIKELDDAAKVIKLMKGQQ